MPPGDSLREQVRRRLASKELFLVSRKERVERGSGNACGVCGAVVSTTEVQYTVRGPTTSVVVLPRLAPGVGGGAATRGELKLKCSGPP
jgi:hypothetical protein